MSERNIFSGMFDFNQDGLTDAVERAIGYQVLEEWEENENAEMGQDED